MQSGWIIVLTTTVVMMMHGYAQQLDITVDPKSALFSTDEDVVATINYKNNGPGTVLICKRYLPDTQLLHPIFDITRDGEHVAYVGPLMKQVAHTPANMIPLKSGETLSAVAEVSSVYNMTESGNYTIEVKTNVGCMLLKSTGGLKTESTPLTVQSTPGVFFAVGRRNVLIDESVAFKAEPKATTNTYIKCSSRRQRLIAAALKPALRYSSSSLQYLKKLTSQASVRYTTWFGKYSSNNLQTLKTHFTNIKAVLVSNVFIFDCGCKTPETFAFVNANKPYKIHICPAFWRAPLTGSESKGGTLVHEISHFTVVADTDDIAYGETDCEALAKSSPSKAIMNADSHEYFAENTPALP